MSATVKTRMVLSLSSALILAIFGFKTHAQQLLGPQEARADMEYLSDMMERIHPDPYTAYGGKIAFKREVVGLKRAFTNPVSRHQFRKTIAGFLSKLGDGHTYIERLGAGPREGGERYIPLKFRAHFEGIHVSDATTEYADLLGYRITAVQGLPLDTLANDVQLVFPKENRPGQLDFLARNLTHRGSTANLFSTIGDTILLSLLTPEGRSANAAVPFKLSREERDQALWVQKEPPMPSNDSGLFYWSMVASESIGYFRLRAAWSREAFELMRASGRTDTEAWLERIYGSYLKRKRPSDLDKAIAELPSLIDETNRLLGTMTRTQSQRLIVDLRGNDGGWGAIIRPFLFLLLGDKYLANPDPVIFTTVISPEKLQIDGQTLDDISEETGQELELGDYIFYDQKQTPQSRDSFIEGLQQAGITALNPLKQRRGPDSLSIIVITDGRTFSAAFDLTYHLWRNGARLVGVPPSQSPEAFVDGTPFILPNSHLEGAISRTAVTYPGIPTSNRAVRLNHPMTWELYRQFGFRSDAEVQYAIDLFLSESD